MTLSIAIESGPSAGWTREFSTREITIGRDPTASVRLASGETCCARGIHARLRCDPEGWALLVEHENGVRLETPRGANFLGKGARAVLPPDARFCLGQSGPRIRARRAGVESPVTIRILTGALASQVFTAEQSEITIGRARHATVRLHPRLDAACASDIHAKIARTDRGWLLTAIHHSGVTIEPHGSPGSHVGAGCSTPLNGPARLTLGPNGPQLWFDAAGDDLTVPHTVAGDGVESRILGESPPLSADRRAAAMTTRERLQKALTNRSRLLGVVASCLLVFLFFGTGRESEQAALRRHLDQARASVYIVGSLAENGAFASSGTAWVVEPRCLATNAHVVEGLQTAARNGRPLVARLPGTPPRDIPITAMTAHPAYRRLLPLMNFAFEARDGGKASMHLAFDVGILELAQNAGRPLPIATRGHLHSLRGGEAVGYVGYPMENITGVHGNQPATAVSGQITAVLDALGQSAEREFAYILQHDLQVTGGSSGSPIIDHRGRVIGINNAGNVVVVPDAADSSQVARISVGLNVAQRIDLLRDLLDRRAETKLPTHESYIVSRLRAAGVSNDAMLIAGLRCAQHGLISSGEIRPPLHAQTVLSRTDTPKSGDASNTYTVSLEVGGRYAVAACATNSAPLRMRVHIDQRVEYEDEGPCPNLGFVSAFHGAARVELVVPSGITAPAGFRLMMIRIR